MQRDAVAGRQESSGYAVSGEMPPFVTTETR